MIFCFVSDREVGVADLRQFTVYLGFFNAMSSMLNQIMEAYGYTAEEAGIMGAVLILSGLVSYFPAQFIFSTKPNISAQLSNRLSNNRSDPHLPHRHKILRPNHRCLLHRPNLRPPHTLSPSTLPCCRTSWRMQLLPPPTLTRVRRRNNTPCAA